jgi:hypothetical protein
VPAGAVAESTMHEDARRTTPASSGTAGYSDGGASGAWGLPSFLLPSTPYAPQAFSNTPSPLPLPLPPPLQPAAAGTHTVLSFESAGSPPWRPSPSMWDTPEAPKAPAGSPPYSSLSLNSSLSHQPQPQWGAIPGSQQQQQQQHHLGESPRWWEENERGGSYPLSSLGGGLLSKGFGDAGWSALQSPDKDCEGQPWPRPALRTAGQNVLDETFPTNSGLHLCHILLITIKH